MNSTNLNKQTEKESFINSLRLIVDAHDLHLNNSETAKAETNTLSVSRSVVGVVYPRTMQQLQRIVKAAGQFSIALYPVSQGKNIGYGDMTPTGNDQLVVVLKHLNAIREFDEINGEVVVEPGVTQIQLAQYLKEKNAKYWADATGASPEASLIGNTLESGFGHTPLGDHRKHILQMQVMLADGSILETAEMPAIGPDLAQLFVQSNFGIVTAIRIPLFPIPEKTVTFTISFADDQAFYSGISILSALRKDGTIASLAHTGNATRALMTSSRFPANRDRSQILNESDCHAILNEKSPIDFGAWATIGGIYGYKSDVRNKQKRMQKTLKGIAEIKFFSDEKINFLNKLLHSKLSLKIKSLDFIRGSFASLKALHEIIRGQPSYYPSKNIFWRVNKAENLGLIWHAPVIPATNADCSALLEAARGVYAKYQFEMPVTLTLINAKFMTAVFNISYDKTDSAQTARAHAAYKDLSTITNQLGYLPYRCGLISDPTINYNSKQFEFLQKMKFALDPKNILAPGRYGIGSN